ncbi:MAG TPA: copper homeostasis protein CutC [Gemmatimonadaceae bacterium]|nr:copper homeostasis protein CutC [Gemmatimonadaceae bacterium]
MPLVESAVDTLESGLCAERAGAGRIELCAGLNDAGTTPSAGLIAAAAERCRIPVFVLIRPRGGGFVYSDDELHVMMRDVEMASSLGAEGIVIGALDASARIDLPKTRKLVSAAKDLPVTFHRAFDLVANLGEALDQLIEVGVARVLTSGGANTALEGAPRIAALIKQAAGRIGIVAGGGVRENNVREIITLTGVKEVHARIASIVCGAAPARSSLKLRKRLPDNEGAWEELDESRMRDLVQQAG